MNKIKILSLIILMTMLISFSLASCAQTTPPPSTPEIPGTEKIELQAPINNGSVGVGGTFQYAPPDKVTFLVLVMGDTITPLKVTGQLVENVKCGSTSDLGMGRNSVSTTNIKAYNATTYTFSGAPPAPPFSGQWFVIGYDANMNLVASSPKWNVTVNGW